VAHPLVTAAALGFALLPSPAPLPVLRAPLASAALAPPRAQDTDPQSPWGDHAARGEGVTLAWEDFDRLLVMRYAMSEDGRAALKQLLRARLLDRLARESKLEIGPAEVQARWEQLDREARAGGESEGLAAALESQGVDQAVFREFLRLAMVQEILSRRALGLPEEREVNAEQQEMWLDQVIVQRGSQTPPPPWPDGAAARCGDVTLSVRDYTLFLRTQLDPGLLREACYQMLLERRARARMPDLAADALAAAVETELERRRAETLADPRTKGLAYEQILSAQGVLLEGLREDPAVVTAALANLWVDRTLGEEGLRSAYAAQREYFDGRYGEFREVRALFLRGAVFKNQVNPRSLEEALAQLAALERRIGALEDFERLVREHSEDPASKDKGGLLGWVPRGDERVPEAIRNAAYSTDGRAVGQGRLVGPRELPGGAALLWIGATRPAPGWDVMRDEVHREMRRRFLEESLPRASVVTYLDR
jgi:hypothetical protein